MIKVLGEGGSGRARGVVLVAAALILGGCVGGSDDYASNLSTTSTTEAAIGSSDTSASTTTTMSEVADTSELTTPPPSTTSPPAVPPADVPPLDLDVMTTGGEVTGPETGVWADVVPAEFRPCENTGPETEAAVMVWTVVRRGEAIGYLVGPVTAEDRASLVRRTYSACAGGADDIAGDPAVRSWSTGCEAGSQVVGRWRDAVAEGENVFVAAIRTGC